MSYGNNNNGNKGGADAKTEIVGAFWTRTGKYGKFLSGAIDGNKGYLLVPNQNKRNDKDPDMLLRKYKDAATTTAPRAAAPAPADDFVAPDLDF